MRRIESVEPFRVMQLLERAKELEAQGNSIIHMEVGEPDFKTPPPVLAAARTRLETGENFYTPSTGLPELQHALAGWYGREYGLDIEPARILITPGTSGAFTLIYAVLLDPGESVLLPDPGYPCQRNFIRLAGGVPLPLPVGPETRYQLHRQAVETGWQNSTRAAVVISPGNPTGTLIDAEELAGIAEACRKRGGWLISDEIYHGLTYGRQADCALAFDDKAIVVNGFSKRWAMTGWRIGWIIVPSELIEPCRRVMQNIFISAPTLSQYAAITALDDTADTERMRAAYDERRRFLLAALPGLGFEVAVEPQGAFYVYANVERITDDAKSFCWELLERDGVAITPGEDFGRYRAEQHVRFSYATRLAQLSEGIRRIARFIDSR